MTTIFYLAQQDRLPSLLSRISLVEDERVLFVVPAGLDLNEPVLRSLRRAAKVREIGLGLVTEEPELRMVAGRLGISTFRDVPHAERARWRSLRS
ncbi:MAG: hypothetical protein ACYCYF_15080, partial [Anaerolineae bacterium]